MDKTAENLPEVRGMKRGPKPKARQPESPIVADYGGRVTISPAQDLANRIWEGQSSSIPRVWRIERVKAGVAAQGFDPESVVFPDA